MPDEMLFRKLDTAREAVPRVVFGYRYLGRRFDGMISITNVRLEIVQAGNGKVTHTLAAPVLSVQRGRIGIRFCDSNLMQVTTGGRAGILIRSEDLRSDEQAHEPGHFGTEEVTENSDEKVLHTVYDFLTGAAYPGYDMRVPALFRVSKNPERLRLNITSELLSALELPAGTNSKVIEKTFLERLDAVAARTQEGGYIFPFEWIHAGGMVCADAKQMGHAKPAVLFTRSGSFFSNWCKANNWQIEV